MLRFTQRVMSHGILGSGVGDGTVAAVAGVVRAGQLASAGRPTMGSSLKGAMVSSVM
jgi:hypothetical protein